MSNSINLIDKFSKIQELWSPKIIGQLNGQDVKLAKLQGEFVWHDHADEDELFFVVKGELTIELRDDSVHLKEGDLYIVPKGVEHKPIAHEEVWVLLFEPSEIKHTGKIDHELTKEKFDWI